MKKRVNVVVDKSVDVVVVDDDVDVLVAVVAD